MAEPKVRFKRDDGSSYPSWDSATFGDTVIIERGGSPRPIEKYLTDGDGYNWVKIGDAPQNGNYITETAQKIIPEGLKKTRQVFVGDLVLSNSMSFGRPYIMGIDGCIHDGWLLIRNDQGLYDLTYLCFLLSSDFMFRQYKSLAGGSAVSNLNKDLVAGTTVFIPSLEEQQKIADFLSTVDEVISTSEAEVKNLKTQKKAVMKKIFSQEVRFKREDGSDFPDWEESTLGDLAYLRGRIGFRGYTRDDLVEKGNGVISLSPSNIVDGFSTYSSNTYISFFKYDESPEIKVSVNDILFTKTGSTVGKIGYVKELPEAATINPQIALITVNGCDPYYLCLAMQSDNNVAFVREITVGGAIPTLSQEELKKMSIPLPSKDEQSLIADFLSDFDEAIAAAKKELELWKELKKGLLQQMFV